MNEPNDSPSVAYSQVADRDPSEFHAPTAHNEDAAEQYLQANPDPDADPAAASALKAKAEAVAASAEKEKAGENNASVDGNSGDAEGESGGDGKTADQPPTLQFKPPAQQSQARDFDKERADLFKKYDDGDLTQAEYDTQRDAITRAEAVAEFESRQVKAQQDSAMAQAGNAFLNANPDWAPVFSTPDHMAKFQSVINAEDNKYLALGITLTEQQLLEKAAKSFHELGFVAGLPEPGAKRPAPSVQQPPPQRRPDLANVPPSLSAAPSAGNVGKGYEDVLGLGYEDLEAYHARHSDDDFERIARTL